MSVNELYDFVDNLKLTKEQEKISELLIKELKSMQLNQKWLFLYAHFVFPFLSYYSLNHFLLVYTIKVL